MPDSEERPVTVYKYRDWERKFHSETLTHRQIYFPPPGKLNDPFDSVLQIEYEKMTPDQLQEFIKDKQDDLFPDMPQEEKELWLRLARKHVTPKGLESRTFTVGLDLRDSIFGMFSVSEKELNNLMWSHYSNAHEGFCVGYNLANLENFLSSENDQNSAIGLREVTYTDNPKVNPLDDDNERLVETLRRKAECWEYEREWRFILTRISGEALRPEHRLLTVPDECISEVILGWRMPPCYKDKIIDVLRGFDSKPDLYRIEPVVGKFELEKCLIHY